MSLTTSNGGAAKIERAISNIQKAKILLGGLPKKYHDENDIMLILGDISRLQAKIKALRGQNKGKAQPDD